MRSFLTPLLLIIGITAGFAQTVGGDPEVRRAIPVTPQAPSEEPAWMREVPVAKAIPVATPQQTPQPPSPPLAEPFRPSPAQPPIDENGSIRIAPSGSPSVNHAQEALERANNLYSRKLFDLAIPEYEMFLISAPTATGRDAALFRLAECHRILGNQPAARSGYERLVMEFQKGEFAGAGAYRLGEFLFSEKIYEAAATQFHTAARESKDDEVRLTALYFEARSLDYLKRDQDARDGYSAVLAIPGKNPYRDHAALALADIDLRNGRKEDALSSLEKLADSALPPISAQAAVKGATLASELGRKDKALALFLKVAKSSDAPDWRPAAILGAMRLQYQASAFQDVVAFASSLDVLPTANRAEALQILAASYRQLGNNLEARRLYDRILKEFPESPNSSEASYQRLVSLYALKDKNLPAEVDAFLEKTTDPKQRTQALLIKAETLFKRADYPAAGKVFDALLARDLSDDVRADCLYKVAWCLATAGDHPAAISAYSDFIRLFPNHALAPTALAQRILSKQATKAFDSAIEDCDALSSQYPGTKEHELALLQKALILGQQQKYPDMSKTFSLLLETFPETTAAAQANFWLGWAAFEQKDYKSAITFLDKARSLNAADYGARASLRIILAYYYLEDRESVAREASSYKGGNLPAEITLWLASHAVDKGDYAAAENYLLPLTKNPASLTPDAWINLAEAQIRLGKFRDARPAADKFLASARTPDARARALLALARIHAGTKNFADANAALDEALLLQPEGPMNAEARILQGDVLLAQGKTEEAARAYMTVSVLTDDPSLTPAALQKAADAYRRANNRFEAEKALAELRQRYPDFQKSQSASKPKP